MATFLARITVKPGAEAEFERIAADLYEATHGMSRGFGATSTGGERTTGRTTAPPPSTTSWPSSRIRRASITRS